MLSTIISSRPVRSIAIPFSLAVGAFAFSATPAHAQDTRLLGITNAPAIVCSSASGSLYVNNSSESCILEPGVQFATGFASGNATFTESSNSTTFSGGTVSFNSVTTAFGGGSVSFNAPVTFTGSSATFSTPTTFQNPSTFNALADFNNGITSDTITNSGTISTSTLSAGTIVGTSVTASGLLRASAGTTVDMGNNVVTNVAAGVANTDAVNVGQLNAATSGIVTDVTALETLTATHTTQIATLNTTTATHTTQISALQAADTLFDTRIDSLEILAAELDDRIDKVDDRASAGTAAAVALSGAMFLPGKSFNLTGNVGSYRGAHAAALQFGALVSDNVALNAGIAHGFNKGGKTAFRAGFTLGW